LSEREEIEEIGEEAEGEEAVGEAVGEEAEAEVSDLLLDLDQINTMIRVTELWDSIVSGKVGIEEAKKLLDRLSDYTKRQEAEREEEEEEEEEATPKAKKAKHLKQGKKKSSKG